MADTFYAGIRKWLAKTALVQNYRKHTAAWLFPKYSAIKAELKSQQRSIVFLCPSTNVPRGGVKVIYNQVAIINEMKGQLTACVLHPMRTDFNCIWFNSNAAFKRDLVFDLKSDFVMIPEFWAVPHARLIHNIGVRYGIYVQGGYIMSRNNGEELEAAYRNAALILAISDDTAECIKMAYPECADRVYRVHCSVNSDKFKVSTTKENIICYMPRRLQRHSQLVTFFLEKKIPPHWRIESIDGLDEDGVVAVFGKSKIFLSFSELEGFGLPPVEAALSGCYVIGYTGEGGKEYWDAEIFTEIYSGDIKAFVKAVLNKIDEIEGAPSVIHTTALKNLANKYSAQVELADMQFVSKKIIEVLNQVE